MRIDEITKDLEKNIDAILRSPNYRKITTSKVPTWATSDGTEGLEIVDGKILNFWFEGGARDYTKAGNMVFEEIKRNYTPKQPEQKAEQVPAEPANGEKSLVACIPDELTISLLEKWKKMSTFERMLMFQKTAPNNIKTRKGRGGEYKYVEGNLMKQEANIAFLFAVSSKIDGWQIDEKGVSCYGSLTVNIDGKDVTVSDVGIDLQETNSKTGQSVFTVHEMMKNACTDMKKRCLACMGFNGDVYRGEV